MLMIRHFWKFWKTFFQQVQIYKHVNSYQTISFISDSFSNSMTLEPTITTTEQSFTYNVYIRLINTITKQNGNKVYRRWASKMLYITNFQEKNISQTSFENFGKMHASKMSYVNLNIFVNSSEIETLTFLDYPRT